MQRWAGRTALVTGASVGIGAAVAKRLAKYGVVVVGCARNVEQIEGWKNDLDHSQQDLVHPYRCDVNNEEDILRLFEHIKETHGGVDICINNAGLLHNAPLLTGTTDMWREMLQVNVLGLSICTREAVKSMRARDVDDGHVINMCSMGGHRLIRSKESSFYQATKFAVKALTEGTRNELRELKSNIRISEISPAAVETELFVRQRGQAFSDNLFKKMKGLQADDIADAVIYILSAPPHVQVHDILVRSTEQVT